MKHLSWAGPLALGSLLVTSLAFGKSKTFKLDYDHVPNQLIVGFEANVDESLKDYVIKNLRMHNEQGPTLSNVQQTVLLQLPTTASGDLVKLAEHISSLPGVRFVEANNIYKLAEVVPNDPSFDKLYGLKNSASTESGVSKDIEATKAWEVSTGSQDILVGVIDTGVDYNHEDIVGNYWNNPGETGLDEDGNDKSTNGIDDDGNGYVDDFRGWDFFNGDNDPLDGHSHGTHCAGTIGAKGNNGIGVVGVNWDVSLVGIKIFSDAGLTNTAAIAAGIDYATTIGVDLTSNSWGGGPPAEAIQDAIRRADENGILFVAAAGNASTNTDLNPHYPSSYDFPNIIAVASTDSSDNVSSFSNYGAESVDVAAPGSDIYSTTPNNSYGYKSGTSMATPHVAGLVALVKSVYPDLGHIELRDRVLSTAMPIASVSGKVKFGRINALSALELDEVAPSAPSTPSVESVSISEVSLAWGVSGDDGVEGTASRYELRLNAEEVTEANWDESEVISFEVLSNDSGKLVAKVAGLAFETAGYVAVKAYDNVGNASPVSTSIQFQLLETETLFANEGTTQQGIQVVSGPWADVVGEDGVSFISDSPEGNYENDLDISFETESFTTNQTDLVLEVDSGFDLERRYDYGYLEVSVGGGEWQQIAEFNGTQDRSIERFSLSNFLESGTEFKLRFRLTTDGSVVRDGWSIYGINLIGAKEAPVVADELALVPTMKLKRDLIKLQDTAAKNNLFINYKKSGEKILVH